MQRRPETNAMATQTEPDFVPISLQHISHNSPNNIEQTQSPLPNSINKDTFNYTDGRTFNRENFNNNLLPNFGSYRHTTSEGPKDTELSEIPSIKKYNKRSGLSTMRDEDLGRRVLDNSLHGSIEERDENEEPEMQDISFRDLDFGVDIVENDNENEIIIEDEEDDEIIVEDEEDDDIGEVFLGKHYSDIPISNDKYNVEGRSHNVFNDPPKSEDLEQDYRDSNVFDNFSSNLNTEIREKSMKDEANLMSLNPKDNGSSNSDLR